MKPSMAQFISDKRAMGRSDSEITHDLLEAGWQMDVIQQAMHGQPIKHRDLTPILDIKNQPYRVSAIMALAVFVALLLLAAFI